MGLKQVCLYAALGCTVLSSVQASDPRYSNVGSGDSSYNTAATTYTGVHFNFAHDLTENTNTQSTTKNSNRFQKLKAGVLSRLPSMPSPRQGMNTLRTKAQQLGIRFINTCATYKNALVNTCSAYKKAGLRRCKQTHATVTSWLQSLQDRFTEDDAPLFEDSSEEAFHDTWHNTLAYRTYNVMNYLSAMCKGAFKTLQEKLRISSTNKINVEFMRGDLPGDDQSTE